MCGDATRVTFPRTSSPDCSGGEPTAEPATNLEPGADRRRTGGAARYERRAPPRCPQVPYFTKDLKQTQKPINARSETVATSGMFKAAFAKRRCLVPAPAYYEWRDDPEGGKTPFAGARGWQTGRLRRDMGRMARAGWGDA
jgi:putative SOS response-associated peptidase YedK